MAKVINILLKHNMCLHDEKIINLFYRCISVFYNYYSLFSKLFIILLVNTS